MADLQEYATQPEVMAALKVTRPLLARLRARPGFPAVRVGVQVLYHREQLAQWLEEHKEHPWAKKAYRGLAAASG